MTLRLRVFPNAAVTLLAIMLTFSGFVEDLSIAAAQEVSQPTSQQATSLEAKSLDVMHPVKLKYLVSTPKAYQTQPKWPLVLFLHGAGERGDNLDLVKVHGPPKLVAQGKDFPFILVAPQCPSNRWWEPISLTALLDEIEANYKVDKSRIYVTGLSMGGFGTWNLAAHSPERFAAIAPICGGGDNFVVPRRIRDQIPAWVFHGEKDSVVPVSRSKQMVASFERYSGNIKLTVYPDAGHDSWSKTYANSELYDWLLKQRRQQPNSPNSNSAKPSSSKPAATKQKRN